MPSQFRRVPPSAVCKSFAAVLLAVAASSWAQAPLPALTAFSAVEHVDWQRYAGQWYELARLPNSFQRKCASDVIAQYSVTPENNLQVVNLCRRDDGATDSATGEARKVAGDQGRLKVRFAPRWLSWVPLVWGDYWVLALDDDYQTALVGTPDHEYLWLLSRTPQRSSAAIEPWLQRAEAMGFDTSRVMLTSQSAANPPLSPTVLPGEAVTGGAVEPRP